jgi:enolase
MLNVLNGGQHASNNLGSQEFMLYPTGAMSFAQGLRFAAQIFQQLKLLLLARGFPLQLVMKEGFAPKLGNHEEAIRLIIQAIQEAGYKPAKQVSLALDPAARQFYGNSPYTLGDNGQISRSSSGMGALYAIVIKLNQIGALSEALDAIALARSAGYGIILSHRCGGSSAIAG